MARKHTFKQRTGYLVKFRLAGTCRGRFPMNREESGIVFVGRGCGCGCLSCTMSEGRIGPAPASLEIRDLPVCHRATIMAGDLIHEDVVPIIKSLRELGSEEVFLYVHPACNDVTLLKTMAESGLTGLHVVIPASDRATLAKLCGARARLESIALLLKAAASLHLDVTAELPVTQESLPGITDTFRRVKGLCPTIRKVALPFRATHGPASAGAWDFRLASEPIREIAAMAHAAGISLTIGGFEGPAPCVIDIEDAKVEHYPGLDGSPGLLRERGAAVAASCASCGIRKSCNMGMHAFAGKAPDPIAWVDPDRSPEPGVPVASGLSRCRTTTLFSRRERLDSLLARAATIDRCMAPWDSIEVHDRTGRVAPCEGSWPRREILGTPDGTCDGWLTDGILKSFQGDRMTSMRRLMVDGGRQATCNRHCPRFAESWSDLPPVRLPRTEVFNSNLALGLSEFIEGSASVKSRPRNITISPSLKCNQRCRMCDLTDEDAGATGIDTPPALLDELVELLPTTATVALTGGEPLTSGRIVKILQSITPERLPDTSYTLTTNGTLLTPALIERLRPTSMARIIVSINAATAATHELVTGTRGTFDKVIGNVAAMVAAAGGMPRKPTVTASFVVMKSNLGELGAFIELAARLKTEVRLLPIERDRMGESFFTDEASKKHAECVVRSLLDRYMLVWPHAARQLEGLLSVLRMRSGMTDPL